jgi:hypothetical protein
MQSQAVAEESQAEAEPCQCQEEPSQVRHRPVGAGETHIPRQIEEGIEHHTARRHHASKGFLIVGLIKLGHAANLSTR